MLKFFKNKFNEFNNLDATHKMLYVSGLFLFIFAIYCCYNLCSQITLVYIDDIMYADWTQKGLKYFIDSNLWHMEYFNGRTFIHLCLQFVLMFKEHLYPILMVIFLSFIFYNFFKLYYPKSSATSKLTATGIGIMLFLSISAVYLTSTLLWMSAGFNYIFPFFLVSFTYSKLQQHKNNEKISILLIILIFLCGATTEQFGLMMVGFIVLTIIEDFIILKRNDTFINVFTSISKIYAPYLFASFLGFVSLFLVPGATIRFGQLTIYNQDVQETFDFAKMVEEMTTHGHTLFGAHANLIIPFMFFMIVGMCALCKNTILSKKYIFTIPVAIVSLILQLLGFYFPAIIIGITTCIILCAMFFFNDKTREIGKLFICGFGSFVAMFFVCAGGTRTTVPFIISMIIIEIALLYEMFKAKKHIKLSVIAIVILLLFTYFNYTPVFYAYKDKKPYCEYLYKEFSNAKTTGIITVDFDEGLGNLTHTEIKGRYLLPTDITTFEQTVFYYSFFDIPDDVIWKFKSEKYDVSSCEYNGHCFRNPVVNINGVAYISSTFSSYLQGEYGRTDEKRMYKTGDILYVLDNNKEELTMYDNGYPVKKIASNVETFSTCSEDVYMFPIDDYCELFDFEYEYDAENNIYRITGNLPYRTHIFENSHK